MTLQVGQGQILICGASSVLFNINAFHVIFDFIALFDYIFWWCRIFNFNKLECQSPKETLNNLSNFFVKISLFVGVGFEGTNTKNGSHELKTIKQKGKVAKLQEEIARKFISTFC